MNFSSKVAAAVLTLAALPVTAQAQQVKTADTATAALTAGATIYGPDGTEVGKVEKIAGDNVVVNTGTHSATLPASSFGKGEKGPSIGFTKAQLDAAIEAANQKAQGKVAAALAPGAQVSSSDGVVLGTVKSVGADGMVVIDRANGSISLKKDMFATNASGLIVRTTAAEIEKAVLQQSASPASNATTDAAADTTTDATAATTTDAATDTTTGTTTETTTETTPETTGE